VKATANRLQGIAVDLHIRRAERECDLKDAWWRGVRIIEASAARVEGDNECVLSRNCAFLDPPCPLPLVLVEDAKSLKPAVVSMTPIETLYQRAKISPNGVAFVAGDDNWNYGRLCAHWSPRLKPDFVPRGHESGGEGGN
jgi:hypothetical protein